jgi:hypothetical protein
MRGSFGQKAGDRTLQRQLLKAFARAQRIVYQNLYTSSCAGRTG